MAAHGEPPDRHNPMKIEELGPDALWRCYQCGYNNLMRSGVYFRQLLRPGLSHAYFQKAIPLLQEYAAANRQDTDPPPGFRERMQACPLSPRDLLHLDYAICLGYVELEGLDPKALASSPVMQWPGPVAVGGVFIAADALLTSGVDVMMDDSGTDDLGMDDDSDFGDGTDDGSSSPPFDL